MERIKEHLGIINGGGEQKYPVSSFVYNCKGDACTGDVVMFEQNVYEMSATGPPCGTRTVAGRIVKESYGSAKQQHTFTIKVRYCDGSSFTGVVEVVDPIASLLLLCLEDIYYCIRCTCSKSRELLVTCVTDSIRWPVIVLAVLAAIVGSQAIIT